MDLEAKIWTVPAVRMKAGRVRTIPLSDRAIAILKKMAEVRTGEFVFPGQGIGRPLSAMVLAMVLRRMDADVTVHGMRSSFRDWAGNETSFPRELCEEALAYVIGDKAEQTYRRGDALKRRRVLMEAWSRYLCGDHANIVVKLASHQRSNRS